MIYRVIGESSEWVWSEESGAIELDLLSPGRLMVRSTPESRITYGAAEARTSGRAFRVIRRKNPSKSMVVYRDDWQVALLPDRD